MDISNNTVRYQTIPTKNVVLETPLEITVTHKINSYIYYVQNLELNNFYCVKLAKLVFILAFLISCFKITFLTQSSILSQKSISSS